MFTIVYRNIYKEFNKALPVKQIIAITGLRRVGKTTSIKYLLNQIKSKNKIFLDLERIEYRQIFSSENYQQIIQSLEIEGIDFTKKAYIALDEIQLVRNISSVIKYIYDTYDVKFLITGSSSFYMKGQFSESLAGRKRLFELWPLGFDEYLRFQEADVSLPEFNFSKTNPHLINKLTTYYNDYVTYGGFPEVTLAVGHENKLAILRDIFDSYINLDVKFLLDFTKSDDLYKLLKLLASRVGNKIDYSKLSGITGIYRQKVKEYLLFLENTFFIKLVKPFVTNPDREIALQNKFYFTDTGFLHMMNTVSSGAVFENAVFNQLRLLGDVRYYAKRSGQEIDFILDGSRAVEVKETPTEHDLKILKNRMKSIGLESYTLVGKKRPGSNFEDFVWGGSIY
jgi:predicted AAA+ superfamily ATPase